MSSKFTVLVNFDGTDGSRPLVGLTKLNGILYGTSEIGGTFSDGTLYSYNLATGQTLALVDFDGSMAPRRFLLSQTSMASSTERAKVAARPIMALCFPTTLPLVPC